MLIKDIKKSDYFKAMDETFLTELLHPENEGLDMGCSIAHDPKFCSLVSEKFTYYDPKSKTEVYDPK